MTKRTSMSSNLHILRKRTSRRVSATLLAGNPPEVGRLFDVHDNRNNASFLVDTGANVFIVIFGNGRPRANSFLLCAENRTTYITFATRQLLFYLGSKQWNLWKFILVNVPTGILGIDFLQRYELFVDSHRLQPIDTLTSMKLLGLNAHTDAYQITGWLTDTKNHFQFLFTRFTSLTDFLF